MSQISIFSNNKKLINSWVASLSASYQVDTIDNINNVLNADVVIIDSKEIEKDAALFSVFSNKTIHFLITGKNWSENNQIKALVHGASGYCSDSESPELLMQAISRILNGDIWIQRNLIPKVIGTLIQMKSLADDTAIANNPEENSKKLGTLSNRELDVAKMIRTGESNKTIAATLFISERTVKAHLTSIYKKLNVSDRLHLALFMKESN